MEKARTQTAIVTTRLAPEMVESLKIAAGKEKRTLSNYISLILENHVEYLRETAELSKARQQRAA